MNQKLFNPDYLLHLCQKYGIRPAKKYGQNFLLESEVIEEMLAAAKVNKKDTVIEVGPGFGVLTFALAERAKKVVAFEIEQKLKPYWNQYCHFEEISFQAGQNNKLENLEIVWGNVLKLIYNQQFVANGANYKVVANLPYQITSNVIRKFLEAKYPPKLVVLMVQKEVAERICAPPGEMSLLSVSVQYYAQAEIVAQVPCHLFWPEPSVDSAVIKLTVRKFDRNDNFEKNFFNVVRIGFSQKRKLLIKNLSSFAPKDKLKDIFKALGLSENCRAQELSLAQWQELVIHLSL